MGLLGGAPLKTAEPFRRLVEMGADALPFLLDSLEDPTPTKLKICPGAWISAEMDINPLNPVERKAVADKNSSDEDDSIVPTRVRIGDVCFVAIGQIVGRPYSAVRYQPTLLVFLNSPLARRQLLDALRAIWSSDNPHQKLFDSLLLDYSTEGKFNGDSLDGLSEGGDFQIAAAMRLLYYYPKQFAPVIVERLKKLDVKAEGDGSSWRDVANGLYTVQFLESLSWCKEPAVDKAMFEIFERTDDARIRLTLLPSVKRTQPEKVVPKLQAMLENLPQAEQERGNGYEVLVALGKYGGTEAKGEFTKYLQQGGAQRCCTMTWVLSEVRPEWAIEFLSPMLTDKRGVRDQNDSSRLRPSGLHAQPDPF